ncbi:MAG: hypothetical protein ABIM20_05790 [candidate division WOR-3 bacterium]
MRSNTLYLFEVIRSDPDKEYYLLKLIDSKTSNNIYETTTRRLSFLKER